ncbi:hemolysin-III related-domain-containing protein [Obelidium mucronatum]|nr:hemolysin-III related-domain-containing protein [Obelidium mucronatum]
MTVTSRESQRLQHSDSNVTLFLVADSAVDVDGAVVVSVDDPNGNKGSRSDSTRRKPKLLLKQDMPAWFQGVSFINSGYRPILPSVTHCLYSLCYIHNETGSIYSHLLAIVVFMGLTAHTFGVVFQQEGLEGVTVQDSVVFIFYFTASILCFFNSAVFHCFCCHSQNVSQSCLMADFVGILVGISAAFVASMYYGFYCNKPAQIGYIIFALCFGMASVILNTSHRFIDHKYMGLRLGMFLAFGISGVIPIIHVSAEFGFAFVQRAMGLNYIFLLTIFTAVAALCFHFKFPERVFPNTFDIWGNSHQIMHVSVVLLLVSHYFGILVSFQFWHTLNGECKIEPKSMGIVTQSYDAWNFWSIDSIAKEGSQSTTTVVLSPGPIASTALPSPSPVLLLKGTSCSSNGATICVNETLYQCVFGGDMALIWDEWATNVACK